MAIAKLDLYRTQLESLVETVRSSGNAGGMNPSVALVERLNETMVQLGESFPEVAGGVPKKFPTDSPLIRRSGLVPISFLDLSIAAETCLALINLIEGDPDEAR